MKEKITNPEIVVSTMLKNDAAISPDEIYSQSKEIKKDVSLSVIGSYLSRNSNNPDISDKYRQDLLFNFVEGKPKKYEIINNNNNKIIALNNSFNAKIEKMNNKKVYCAVDLFNIALTLDKTEFDRLFNLLYAMKK